VPKFKLNNGIEIPALGFGTFQIKSEQTYEAVSDAIEVGYRHIDTAWVYFNERSTGKALKHAIESKQIRRENFFITTKVWNNFHGEFRPIKGIEASLKDLGLKYVDLALIHFPTGLKDGENYYPLFENKSVIPRKWEKDSYVETWKGMELVQKLGYAKSIGVANFNLHQLNKILENAEIKPVVNQVIQQLKQLN
jgi:diketogulonate reductase-like aldo/keto reductase